MQFNGNDATNVLFNCYSSASQSPVTLYPYSMVKADTTPRITVEDTEYNVSADDETLEFSYTTKNIDGTPTVSVDGATMTNVEADAEAGIVTVIFDANAEEVEKTATLILSYEGAQPVSVTITQAAKVAQGGDDTTSGTHYVKVTSAPTDWTGDYLIVCEDGNVAFDGSLTTLDAVSNTVTVDIEDGKIEATDAMKSSQFTIDASGIVKSASGYNIGQTSNANGLKSSQSTEYTNTISVNNDGTVNIVSGGAYLRYNATAGQCRFRYYKSSSYTNQKAIQLYKLN